MEVLFGGEELKILIAPMAAMAETSGPFSRAKKISQECLDREHKVVLCAAEDINYRPIEGVQNYYAPTPAPFGLPMFLGKRLFKLAQKLGVQQKRTVNSYEEVLHIIGAISKKHFKKDVKLLRQAIRKSKPDVIYSEFRIAAIVAAKLEDKKVITSYSYPAQKSYACNPEYSKHVRRFLKNTDLPEIKSVLEIFDWSDLKIIPSSYDLEPIDDENVVFTGPFNSTFNNVDNFKNRKKIVVYMGNGTITPRKLIEVMKEAFLDSKYEVYIATKQFDEFKDKNIIVAKRFNFNRLLPESIAFINHGGQNSIMDGLLNNVPQIICPGKIFERKYNARSIENLNAGKIVMEENFNANTIIEIVKEFSCNNKYFNCSKYIGKKFKELGGVKRVVNEIEKFKSD